MTPTMKQSLDSVLSYYKSEDINIFDYLTTKNFKGDNCKKTLTIEQSIDRIVGYALKNADKVTKVEEQTNEVDTVAFADIHGQLDLFVQNLYFAGVIDKDGSLKQNCRKTVIQLGDIVDRGAYSIESIVYMRMLQKQAEESHSNGAEIKFLIGNHELYHVDLYFAFNKNPCGTNSVPHWEFKKDPDAYATLRKMILHDITSGKIKLTYADKDTNIFFSHASLEKKILVRTLMDMATDEKYKNILQNRCDELKQILAIIQQKNELKNEYFNIGEYSYDKGLYVEKAEKISDEKKAMLRSELRSLSAKTSEIASSQNIYSIARQCGISLKDISDYMNNAFSSYMKERYVKNVKQPPHFLLTVDSLLVSRKKSLNQKRDKCRIVNYIPPQNMRKYQVKPILVSGHEVTDYIYGGIRGAIKQNRANVFLDVGLTSEHGGRQAFLGINKNSRELFAYEYKDIKSNEMLSGLEIKHFANIDEKHQYEILNPINVDKKKLYSRQLYFQRDNSPLKV